MLKRTQGGFSLLELLIVVAIILIIATIATTSLVQARQSANEASAVTTMRTIHAAQLLYSSANGGRYGDFAALTASGLLDERFVQDGGTPTLSGYTFILELEEETQTDYSVQANPASGTMGRFDYYSGADAVVRYRTELGGRTPGAPVQ